MKNAYCKPNKIVAQMKKNDIFNDDTQTTLKFF